jgi:hypothetical protein
MIPREPWYYRFLDSYARAIFGLGLLQFMVISLVVFFGTVYALGTGTDVIAGIIALWIVEFWSFCILVGAMLASCPILLVVDAARNIRAIRYRIRK